MCMQQRRAVAKSVSWSSNEYAWTAVSSRPRYLCGIWVTQLPPLDMQLSVLQASRTNKCDLPTVTPSCVLTGDEAFELAKYMLKPFPTRNLTAEQRIANYHISWERRISENLLGIWGNRWPCFRVPFLLAPEKIQVITLATLTLHNWLRADASTRNVYCPQSSFDRDKPETAYTFYRVWHVLSIAFYVQ